MYRKSMAALEDTGEGSGGSLFMNRLAQLPLSQMAVLQFTSIYNKAKERPVLGTSLQVGEGTFHLALKIASPIVTRLPVSRIDDIAARQLEKLEEAVPAIKKDPKPLMEKSGEMVNNALELGYSTVAGVKTFAVETTTPTVERVSRASNYGKQTVDNMRAGVSTTLTSMKDNVQNLTLENVRTNLSSTYTAVRSMSMDDVKTQVSTRRDQVVGSVKAGVDGVTQEVSAYATETLTPTVTRYTAARQYTVEKVSETYTGVRDRVAETRVGKGLSSTVSRVLDISERALDSYLPERDAAEAAEAEPAKPAEPGQPDAAAVHPASAEAGSWSRSMVLLSNLRGRLQAVGRRNYDHYATRAGEMVTSVKSRYAGPIERAQSAYNASHSYVTNSYESIQSSLSSARQSMATAYGTTRERIASTRARLQSTYETASERFRTNENVIAARERMSNVYAEARSRLGKASVVALENFERFDLYLTDKVRDAYAYSMDRVTATGTRSYEWFSARYPKTAERMTSVTGYVTSTAGVVAEKSQVAATYMYAQSEPVMAAVARGMIGMPQRARTAFNYGYELSLFVVDEARSSAVAGKISTAFGRRPKTDAPLEQQ